MSLQLELPQLSPPAMSRASSLARRCSGIAWPLQQQSRQQLLQQQASSSFLHVEECVHVIFFTPEEAAAVASSSSSLISTIMRSRANIFPVPAPFARQSHVTILATSGEHAAQKLRSATRSNGVRGGPIVIDLNHGLSGEINLPALAAIIHQGSNCLASSSSVLFVDIITQENIFTELSLAVHHDMMNASHTAEWSHDGSLDSSTTHLRFKSANRQHVQSSWFAGPCSSVSKLLLSFPPATLTSLHPRSFHPHIMSYLYPPLTAQTPTFRLLPIHYAWPLQTIAEHVGCPGDPSRFAPKTCARDESMPWLWLCPQQQQQQQQWSMSLFGSCRPRSPPPRILVPFYSVTDSLENFDYQQQQQQQQQTKLFTVHSFDLHISPPLHLKDLWQPLGVHMSIASLSGACSHVDTCAPGGVSAGEINAQNAIYLQPLPPPRTPRIDSPQQRSELLTKIVTCYSGGKGHKACSGALAGLMSADAVLASHPFSLMQIPLALGVPVIAFACTRFELGRDDSPDAFGNLVKWVKAAEIWRENVIASNNAYDEMYIKYFTGIDTGEEIRTFGHSQPHSSSSGSAAVARPGQHFSRLLSNYLTLRHVTYRPSSLSLPSMLIDYGHDHPIGSPVEWRSKLGRDFSSHVIKTLSLSPLTAHWRVQTLRNAYPKHYSPLNLASHTLLLLLPYQVSVMSFAERFYAGIPMLVPSLSMLTRLHADYRLMFERTVLGTRGARLNASIFSPPTPPTSDPNDESGEDLEALAKWLSLSEFYTWPHILQFNDLSEIPVLISSTNFTQVSMDMRSHARKSRDMTIERWRQLLHRVRVCKQCLDCATCVGGHERDLSSAAVLSPLTTVTAYPPSSSSSSSSAAAAAAASVSSSSSKKLSVACKFYERKENLNDHIIVMDDECLSLLTRHTSHGSGRNELERLKDECHRLENQQQQKQHVVEVHLPADPEALWKSRMCWIAGTFSV